MPRARPWQPGDPYLYRLEVTHGEDEYCLTVGIRMVRVAVDRLLLNGVPVRLRGFGMHEDVALRGKGHDDARMVRDFALLDWVAPTRSVPRTTPTPRRSLTMRTGRGCSSSTRRPPSGCTSAWGTWATTARGPSHPKRSGRRPPRRTWPPSASSSPVTATTWRDRLVDRERARHGRAASPVLRPADGRGARAETWPARCHVATARPEADVVSDLFDLICVNRYSGWYSARGPGGGDEAAGGGALGLGAVWQADRGDRVAPTRRLACTRWPGGPAQDYQVAPIAASCRSSAGSAGDRRARVGFADSATAQAAHRPGDNHMGVFTGDRSQKRRPGSSASRGPPPAPAPPPQPPPAPAVSMTASVSALGLHIELDPGAAEPRPVAVTLEDLLGADAYREHLQ